jgi:hypothetical protein
MPWQKISGNACYHKPFEGPLPCETSPELGKQIGHYQKA